MDVKPYRRFITNEPHKVIPKIYIYHFKICNVVIICVGMVYLGPSQCALKIQMLCNSNEFDASKVTRQLGTPSAQRGFDKIQDISRVIQKYKFLLVLS